MTTMSKTYQHMKCEVKHNGDLGTSHLWLNGVGSYEKVSCCFFWKCAKKSAGLQRSTLFGHHMTTGFGLFELLAYYREHRTIPPT